MKLAHYIQRYPPALGGSEAYFARLCQHLATRGHAVTVTTTTAIPLEAFWLPITPCLPVGTTTESGVEVHRYQPVCRFRGRRFLLKPLSLIPQRLWQCLTITCNPICPAMWHDAVQPENSVDLVHASAFPYGWPLACALRRARHQQVPYVLTPFLHLGDVRGPGDRTRRAYLAPALLFLARQADRVFVQTRLEQQALLAAGLEPKRVILQGLGVDPLECTGGDRAAARRRWGLQEDEVVFGHLANNSVEKGSVDLLRAASLLLGERTRFRVLLAGPEMPNFREFWTTYMDRDQVIRLGAIDEATKRDFYAVIDAFVLPSRSDSFGLVLLEAWANQIPNLAYRAGGPAEVIHDRIDGLLVDCGDVAGLARAMLRLLREPGLRIDLGRSGFERTRTEFSWHDKLRLVEQVYEDLM